LPGRREDGKKNSLTTGTYLLTNILKLTYSFIFKLNHSYILVSSNFDEKQE